MIVGIIGMGYVGLTLAVALAERNVKVIGLDIDLSKIQMIASGKPPFYEEGFELSLRGVVENGNLKVTDRLSDLTEISHCVITVGTPLLDKSFDTSQIEKVILDIGKLVNPDTLVCLRSTVGLGTSRKLQRILLELGHSGEVAMCPERTIEGFALSELYKLPQIIGVETQTSKEMAETLFSKLGVQLLFTDSFEIAELAKLACNAWRDLYFAFANEVALIGEDLGVNARKALNIAAVDYPRFRAATPGPVGGPCLVKDGISLASSSSRREKTGSLFDTARRINESVVEWSIQKSRDFIASNSNLSINIGVIGLTFKSFPPTDDLRDSPTISYMSKLKTLDTNIQFFCWDSNYVNQGMVLNKSGESLIKHLTMMEQVFLDCKIVTIWHKLTPQTKEKLRECIIQYPQTVVIDSWANFSENELTHDFYYAFGNGGGV